MLMTQSPARIQETQDSGRQNECKHPGKTRKPDIGNTKLETNSKHQETSKERDDSTKDEGRQRQQTLTCKLGTEVQKGES